MTLDEAIAKYNKLANNDRTCYPGEAQQLAEWLEELKELRNMTAGHLYAVAFKNGYLKAEKEVRNKVLDDFVKFASDMPTVETEDGEIRPMWLEEIAEQLKAGEDNV